MLVLFNVNKNNTNIDNLLLLRSACIAGFVNMSKTEWDNMNYYDSLFLIIYESKKQEKESNDMRNNK